MPRNSDSKDKARLSVSLPTKIVEDVHTQADERLVGEGWIVQRALEAFLPTLPPLPSADAPRA